jgi:dUTP pyrophosphatase
MNKMKINIKKLHPEAKVPESQTEGSAGYDIYSLENTEIKPGETALVRTGVALEPPKGVVTLVFPRGSLCLKKHLDMPNSVGVGDQDFRGEYVIPFRNLGKESVTIDKHERCAQFIFVNYHQVDFELVEDLGKTARGEGKLGSTGK